MELCVFNRYRLRASGILAATLFLTALAVGEEPEVGHETETGREPERSMFVLTSTNDATNNHVVVFKLDTAPTPSLSLVDTLSTGGKGGAQANAGILQFKDNLGAVANYGSNSVTQLLRHDDWISVGETIDLAHGCAKPVSVALNREQLLVVGATCVESHSWPSGALDGTVVRLADPSAAQVAIGKTWASVTLTSGSVLQLELTHDGALSGTSAPIRLPNTANDTPLGAAFWGNILGYTPAHSSDSFVVVNQERGVAAVC